MCRKFHWGDFLIKINYPIIIFLAIKFFDLVAMSLEHSKVYKNTLVALVVVCLAQMTLYCIKYDK